MCEQIKDGGPLKVDFRFLYSQIQDFVKILTIFTVIIKINKLQVKCFNLYVKFPKNRWKEIERAEKNDLKGNKIYKELKKEYLEKYMPSPDADPHGTTPLKNIPKINENPYCIPTPEDNGQVMSINLDQDLNK